MARRSGQEGYVERKGGQYHVRFRIDEQPRAAFSRQHIAGVEIGE